VMRSLLYGRSGIGSWLYCLQFISLFAVICNCNLLARLSSHLHLYIPDAVGGGKEAFNDETYKVVVMLLLDHLIVGVTLIVSLLIDDVPRWVRSATARQHLRDRALLHQYVADSSSSSSSSSEKVLCRSEKQLQIHSHKRSVDAVELSSSVRRTTNVDTIGSPNHHRGSPSNSDATSPSQLSPISSAKASDSSPGSVKRSWFPSFHLKNT